MDDEARFTAKDLKELQARDLPHCTVTDIFEASETTSPELLAKMERVGEYLARFLPPSKDCIHCLSAQDGLMASLLLTGFTWGLAHGEGFCNHCGYPARAYHEFKGPDGVKEFSGSMILQYHPSGLSFDRKERHSADAVHA